MPTKPPMREFVAACIAWPSMALFVLSLVGLSFYEEQARWLMNVGLSGMTTAIAIGNKPLYTRIKTRIMIRFRPWLEKARSFTSKL